MKKLFYVFAVLAAMAIPLVSYAGNNNNQNNWDNITNNYYTTNEDNRTINEGGKGYGGSAYATGGKAEANSLNLNNNSNRNENTNLNAQKQGQAQGQAQGQLQGQAQGQTQSANNEGNTLQVTQNYERDKRELINPAPAPMVDPKLTNGKAGAIKTKGSLWDNMSSIKKEQASKVLKGAGLDTLMGPDVKSDVRAVSEKDFQTDSIALCTKKPAGEYLATIYVYSTGADSQALEAVAILAAMKLGGTHIVFEDRDHSVVASGKAWGFGLGGGASMFAKGDDIAVAPGGGLGLSGAEAKNESLPQLRFTVYCDQAVLAK